MPINRLLSLTLSLLAISITVAQADMFDELERETQSTAVQEKSGDSAEPVATSGPAPQAAEDQTYEEFKKQHLAEYSSYKEELLKEFDAFKTIQAEEQEKHQKRISTVWDKAEVSSKKIWVEYSEDLHEKKAVDFEKGTVTISTTVLGNNKPTEKELRASVTALLEQDKAQAFRDDKVASAVEKRTREELNPDMVETATVEAEPILIPYITGKNTDSPKVVDYIADSMIKNKETRVSTNKKGEKVVTTVLPLDVDLKKLEKLNPGAVANVEPISTQVEETATEKPAAEKTEQAKKPEKRSHLPRAALPYAGHVASYAESAKVKPSLVFAVMETESAFNPMAKSGVPAYGLMQIVPRSAGQDATEQLFGKPKILSPSYLYDSEKNIQIGTTYLNILYYRYLKGIEDPLSRLYCSIAAYNTGAGNVAKAFTGERKIRPALKVINKLTPEQVYKHLRKNLPYEETQHYLKKVNHRIEKYES